MVLCFAASRWIGRKSLYPCCLYTSCVDRGNLITLASLYIHVTCQCSEGVGGAAPTFLLLSLRSSCSQGVGLRCHARREVGVLNRHKCHSEWEVWSRKHRRYYGTSSKVSEHHARWEVWAPKCCKSRRMKVWASQEHELHTLMGTIEGTLVRNSCKTLWQEILIGVYETRAKHFRMHKVSRHKVSASKGLKSPTLAIKQSSDVKCFNEIAEFGITSRGTAGYAAEDWHPTVPEHETAKTLQWHGDETASCRNTRRKHGSSMHCPRLHRNPSPICKENHQNGFVYKCAPPKLVVFLLVMVVIMDNPR